mmetsp:Transcript_12483/g.20741  ORF Transcript_12483/g.20741 Transcript_12483/m.20741 type:complete len:83 (+) Transcript_12483:684-932(+)
MRCFTSSLSLLFQRGRGHAATQEKQPKVLLLSTLLLVPAFWSSLQLLLIVLIVIVRLWEGNDVDFHSIRQKGTVTGGDQRIL